MNYLGLIFLSILVLAGCDTSTFTPPKICDGDNCTSSSESSASGASGVSGANSQTVGGNGGVTSGVGTITPNSGSAPSSGGGSPPLSTGSGGFANSGISSGGGSDARSGGSSGQTIIEYKSPGGYSNYFAKINEPIDQQVSEKLPFALKFVAVGKMPLKYSWFKEEGGGSRQLSVDTSVFSKDSAALSDSGTYFARVEDADGNVLTSRRATLKINQERKECFAGEYGPEKYDSQSQSFDYSNLVPRARMNRTIGAKFYNLGGEIDGYALSVNRCIKYYGSGSECTSGGTLLQCQNGAYTIVSTTCRCYN